LIFRIFNVEWPSPGSPLDYLSRSVQLSRRWQNNCLPSKSNVKFVWQIQLIYGLLKGPVAESQTLWHFDLLPFLTLQLFDLRLLICFEVGSWMFPAIVGLDVHLFNRWTSDVQFSYFLPITPHKAQMSDLFAFTQWLFDHSTFRPSTDHRLQVTDNFIHFNSFRMYDISTFSLALTDRWMLNATRRNLCFWIDTT